MKQTRLIMGMPITVEIVDQRTSKKDLGETFAYFVAVDNQFSPYKKESEVSQINLRKVQEADYSREMKTVLDLCEDTKKETGGYFDVWRNKELDPSGLVKGWAILNAAQKLEERGFKNFYVEAGGDIQVKGKNASGKTWTVGIRNPFNRGEIVKVVQIEEGAVATSGNYIRGNHIYNPKGNEEIASIVSLTVIGPNILDADRFVTAAFAMGEKGIDFIENLSGFEGYLIDKKGRATLTSGFKNYLE